jgi:hypothetical protein
MPSMFEGVDANRHRRVYPRRACCSDETTDAAQEAPRLSNVVRPPEQPKKAGPASGNRDGHGRRNATAIIMTTTMTPSGLNQSA